MKRSTSLSRQLDEAERLPAGFARTAAVEQVVRAADEAQDLDAAFTARMALASAAEHGGEPQKALVAVTWCLGQIDAHPGRFDVHNTYWALKWLPSTLLSMPDVPLDEVTAVQDEVARRYAAEGTGEDAVAKLRWSVPLSTGRVEEAVQAHRQWRLLPRSEYSDCRACDVYAELRLALAVGDRRRALDVARPVLTGRLECAEEPARVLARLLTPLSELGEHEEAERLHVWGLRLARGNPSLVEAQAEHVSHLVRTGRLDDALGLLAELVAVCDRGLFAADARMHVAAVGSSVAACLAERGTAELSRPLDERPTATAALADHFAEEAAAVAAAFDRRNGTTACTAKVQKWIGVRPHAPAVGGAPAATSHGGLPPAPVDAASSTSPAAPASRVNGPDELLEQARTGRVDDKGRLALAEQARRVFLERGDAIGAARARRTVGTALLRLGRDDEAEAELQSAYEALAGHPDEQVVAALALARLTYEQAQQAGSPDSSARAWLAGARLAAEAAADRALLLGRCRVVEAEWLVLGARREDGPPDASDLQAGAAAYAEARALVAGDDERLVDAWASEAWSRGAVGDLAGAMQAARSAWSLAAQVGDAEVADTAELVVPLLLADDETAEALDVLASAQRAEERLEDRSAAAQTAMMRADLLVECGRAAEALPAAWEASDLFAAGGDASGAAWAKLTAARVFAELDQPQTAYDLWSELVEQAADDDDRRLEGAVALDLARLDADYGHLEDALGWAQRAVERLPADEPADVGRAYRVLADVLEAQQQADEALQAGQQAVAAFAQADDEVLLAEGRAEQADRLVRAARPAEALELYTAARQGFVEEQLSLGAATVDLGLADALSALSRPEDAVAAAERAVRTGREEDVPELVADALWAVAVHNAPDAARYDDALAAYVVAGSDEAQLSALREQRDAALHGRRKRWRR